MSYPLKTKKKKFLKRRIFSRRYLLERKKVYSVPRFKNTLIIFLILNRAMPLYLSVHPSVSDTGMSEVAFMFRTKEHSFW